MAIDLEPPIVATEPELADEDKLYEVVDGQIVSKKMGALELQVAARLFARLSAHVEGRGLGTAEVEMIFLLDPSTGLQRRPDVAFVSRDRWPIDEPAPRTVAWEVVPDLVVEVVSPTNRAADLAARIEEYFRAGVRQVWAVYPVQRVVYRFDAGGAGRILRGEATLDAEEVVPGFRLPLATVFRRGPGAA